MLEKIKRLVLKFKNYGYTGHYNNWKDAVADSSGYDADIITRRTYAAAMQVKNGEVAYEHDSYIFFEPAFEWPLLSTVNWVAAQNRGEINVLDFGGSLGSHYFQHRTFFSQLPALTWNIVEQPAITAIGMKDFSGPQLRFFESIEDCKAATELHLAVLGCVLPYLEHPYEWLEKIYRSGIPYVLVDKHPVINGTGDRLTVQKVNPAIYAASYPAWFFSESRFLHFMKERYEVVATYICPDICNVDSVFKGYLFKRKA